MARTHRNFVKGTTDAALDAVGTTLTAAELAAIGESVVAPDTLTITLDPNGTAGDPEIVNVTDYTEAATTATIARGVEGTTARSHASGTAFVHALTALDFGYDTPAPPGGGGGAYADQVTALSPIHYWRMDDSTAPTVMADEVVTGGMDGSHVNGVTFGTDGPNGAFASYDGTDDHSIVACDLSAESEVTFVFLARGWTDIGGKRFWTHGAFGYAPAVPTELMQVDSAANLAVGMESASAHDYYSRSLVQPSPDVNWHHYAIVMGRNPEQIKVYINGTLQGLTTTSNSPVTDTFGSASLVLAAGISDVGAILDHNDIDMSDFSIHSGELTEVQIDALVAAAGL